jgi:hypothetical protein
MKILKMLMFFMKLLEKKNYLMMLLKNYQQNLTPKNLFYLSQKLAKQV